MGCNTPTIEKLNAKKVQHESFLKGELSITNDKLIINFLSGYIIFNTDFEIIWTSAYQVGTKKPIEYEGGVLLPSADDFIAFNTVLGEISWKGHLYGVHPGAFFIKENEVQVIGFKEKKTKLITFDLSTGKILGEITFSPAPLDDTFTYVGVSEDLVLFISRKQKTLFAYSKEDTTKAEWKIGFDNRHYNKENFLLTKNNLLFVKDDIVYCLDLASGKIINKYQTQSDINKVEAYGDNLFLFTSFSILSLNIHNMNMRYKIESADISDPTVDIANNSISFFSDKTLKIHNLETGKVLEEVDLNLINATNAVFYKDAYFFVSQDGEWIKVSL